ncbi:AraC family transcriptional regulator [Agrilutibacter solisilvae]|uniref:AraC family transcriptional regulator n=1 Tax=Agrilutibacter solisilvae TaxID=2763317 RepID=A0A975ASV5_9GAMM|nr:AraC family transcriptional regulator [Lysobacter solisilvae]QSX78653.1 AraC family transcriptional regulator [Lysobacter solisilvae]
MEHPDTAPLDAGFDELQAVGSDPRLSAASIKSTIVAGLMAMAREQGQPCEPWFAGSRLSPTQFEGGPAESLPCLSYRQASQIIRRALRSLPGQGHGLALGARQDIGSFGLLGLAMLTAPDFEQALRLAIRYAPITGAMVELSVEDVPEGLAVVATTRDHDRELEPFLCEELFVSSLGLCRGLLGPGFRPRVLELAYPPPEYADRYAAAFECEVRFHGRGHRVVIDRAWLSTPMPAHNAATARQVLALCDGQMPSAGAHSEIAVLVERLLRTRLADNPRLVDIAAELHLTERTLRRQLQAAQTSFTAIHDRVRSESARRLLGEARLNIAQVGVAVGFRDAREFRRAFKRWTGVAPQSLRRTARAAPAGG